MNNEQAICNNCFGGYIAGNEKEHECPEVFCCGACGEIVDHTDGEIVDTNGAGFIGEFVHRADLCSANDEIGLLCNLCGNEMTDEEEHSFFEPFGEVCEECTTEIKTIKEAK